MWDIICSRFRVTMRCLCCTVKTTLVCSAGTKAMSGHRPDCDDLTVCDYTTVRGQDREAAWTDRTQFSHTQRRWRADGGRIMLSVLHSLRNSQSCWSTSCFVLVFFFQFGNMQKNMSHVTPLLQANTHV